MLERIKQIIDSCKTLDQCQSCISFAEWPRPGIGLEEKLLIMDWIRARQDQIRETLLVKA